MTSKAAPGNEIEYRPLRLARKQFLNRWAVTNVIEDPIVFTPVTMSGEINDWLTKGFAIHENPSRREVAELRRSNPPDLPRGTLPPLPGRSFDFEGHEAFWNLDFPWENPRLERSGFWFTPTRLRLIATATLIAKEEASAHFELATCGSVSIRLNGKAVLDFAPLTRNAEKRRELTLPLREGRNEVIVHCEDIAERDTLYYFQLAYTGAQDLTIVLPTGAAGPEQLALLETALGTASFPAETIGEDPVRLSLENPLPTSLAAEVERERLLGDARSKRLELSPESSTLELGTLTELGLGYSYFTIALMLEKVIIRRRLGAELYPSDECARAEAAAGTADERKAYALRSVAERGGANAHTALARLALGMGWDARTVEFIRRAIEGVNERRDCSDFYLVALIRIWREYAQRGECPSELRDSLERCILGFRYWIDEPGSDVMWFFSENHALLFHVCELLAGESFPDREFRNSGRTGEEHATLARERLLGWFRRIGEEGFAEWNSSAYLPIDSIGLFALRDLSRDKDLAERAEGGLSLLFHYLALQSFHGILAASFGRTYEEELVGHRSAGTSAMNWIGTGVGFPSADSLANTFFALSTYLPSERIEPFVQNAPFAGRVIRFQQGKGGYARIYTYCTPAYTMSSVQDYRPGSPGYQEHVFHLALSTSAHVWVNHPGELARHGSGRPSYWAGNGILPKVAQYRGVAILIFRLPEDEEITFTHARWPWELFDETQREGEWLVGRLGVSYAGICCPGQLIREDVGAPGEIRAEGRRVAWILRAGSRNGYKTIGEFAGSLGAAGFDPETLAATVEDARYGTLRLSWEEPLTLDGAALDFGEPGIRGELQDITSG